MNEVTENSTMAVAYSVDEFCRAYHIGRSLFYEEVAAGRLRVRKAGRRTLISPADAQAWFDALPSGSESGEAA